MRDGQFERCEGLKTRRWLEHDVFKNGKQTKHFPRISDRTPRQRHRRDV